MTKHIVIVGGGYTGACAAIQLNRQARRPLRISVLEPRAEVGQGLAYSTTDPDHRLNAPDMVHFVTPENQEQLRRWYLAQGGTDFDAAADPGDGALFVRRGDFGRFMTEQFAAHRADNASGSSIDHVRDRALDIETVEGGFHITLESGGTLRGDLVVVATSNERPAVPAPFEALAGHPAFHDDPWDQAAIRAIPTAARLLFVGTALTSADLIVTRLRLGHRGPITALSRRGLRATRRAVTPGTYATPFWERIDRQSSIFIARHGRQNRVIDVMRALRADIRAAEAQGHPWQAAFDDLRDSVWQVWPNLPLAEKRRFMRHLRVWYDVHRFRLPPQLETILDNAVAQGRLVYKAARIASADAEGDGIAVTYRERNADAPQTERVDAIVNCTGPEPRPDRTRNPFMRALVARGLARTHPAGVGFDVTADCAAIGADGTPNPRLRVFGPLTLGAFGDPQGTPFILRYIRKTAPQIAALLDAR